MTTPKQLKYHEVFVPGGFPYHTYNPRAGFRLEAMLTEVTRNLCKLATVTGQTKSGKTVLVRKVLPSERCIWVDGGSVSSEDDFWSVLNERLNAIVAPDESTTSEEVETTNTYRAHGDVKIGVANVGAEVGRESRRVVAAPTSEAKQGSPRVRAIAALRCMNIPLVIDDFHYLNRALQGTVVRALKQPVFDGIPVALIAIPHRRYDALKVEKEMTGRIHQIEIPSWTETELGFISTTGFRLLGWSIPFEVTRKLADEAIGSPHLMQDFCRTVCATAETAGGVNASTLASSSSDLPFIFRAVAESIGRPIFEKLARGPRSRTDRIPRELKDGRSVDIYQLVLHALAHLKPGLVSLEYEDLRSAIRDVSASQIPQLQEVARVLKQMATIASNDQSSTPVIDFEEADRRLHITDPFFAFYLRWGSLSR